jgi:hypothetical protein
MFAWAVSQASAVIDGQVLTGRLQWVPDLHLVIGTRLDGFASWSGQPGIGVVVQLYARHLLQRRIPTAPPPGRLLLVFTAAMAWSWHDP